MQLKEWIFRNKLSAISFADLVDSKKSTVYNWMNKHQRPSRIFMKKIIAVTKGKVSEKDWE